MLETIESYLVAILPAATAVISALAILIKMISALKEAKSNTAEQVKQIRGLINDSSGKTTETNVQLGLLVDKVSGFVKDSNAIMCSLQAKIDVLEASYKQVDKLCEDYQKVITEQNKRIYELEKSELLNSAEEE